MAGPMIDVVPSKIESILWEATFPEHLKLFSQENYHVASLAESASLRIQYGRHIQSTHLNVGHFVKECFLYRFAKPRLLRNSPILLDPERVIKMHSQEQEHYLNKAELEACIEDSCEIPASIKIPVKHLSSEKFFVWAFGEKTAKEYGDFLNDELQIRSIEINPLAVKSTHAKPFVRQAFFDKTFNYSCISGDSYSSGIQTWRGIKQVF